MYIVYRINKSHMFTAIRKRGSGFNNNTEMKTIYGNGIDHTYKYYKSL